MRHLLFALLALLAFPAMATAQQAAPYGLEAIDSVWSSHPVRFAIVQDNERLYVGYYDATRQLTIAQRRLKGGKWVYQKLDSWLGWDSHNSVAIAVVSLGFVHVAANMHADPLVYFRSSLPGDVRSLKRVATMADRARERRITYPRFTKGAAGELIFMYRDGGSGDGNEIYLVHDAKANAWRSLFSGVFVDGEKQRNAYFVGPIAGPDGYFHLTWVWRDTPDAATNHDLSYARSRDLVNWERSDGTALQLPIRFDTAEIVDPVPTKAGMINNNTLIGFDSAGRVLIAYQKYDEGGQTQIYIARRDAAGWSINQVTRWKDFRWEFGGYGSIRSRLSLSAPSVDGAGKLKMAIVKDDVHLDLEIDEATLEAVGETPSEDVYGRLVEKFPPGDGMQLNTACAAGAPQFCLAWQTRKNNNDKPYADILAPTTLLLVDLKPKQ